ncbi:hypothetical protein NBRC116188_14350 [Oceaniserpentilla sp. 4NH20-0058]|uniref:RNA polymerase sigma factor n=1 Tax=Oceaniserpentilla sp. 4NH20-0058 TaxID=3127660 RepID=UPI003103B80E
MEIEALVSAATKGNKNALEQIAVSIQDRIYALALRMLANPMDAQDATQEILIKVITNLSTFKFNSQFTTWVYRIAVNHLINSKKMLDKELGLTFDMYREDLESDLQAPSHWQEDAHVDVLLNELRISCTMAMLLCLKPVYRMAYILGDILDMEHQEASDILSISKDNFRQQLSRARAKIINFMNTSCGFVNHCAKCSCEKKLTGAISRERINPDSIFFSTKNQYTYSEIKESLATTQQDLKALASQKSIQTYKSPIELGGMIESLINEGIRLRKNTRITQ